MSLHLPQSISTAVWPRVLFCLFSACVLYLTFEVVFSHALLVGAQEPLLQSNVSSCTPGSLSLVEWSANAELISIAVRWEMDNLRCESGHSVHLNWFSTHRPSDVHSTMLCTTLKLDHTHSTSTYSDPCTMGSVTDVTRQDLPIVLYVSVQIGDDVTTSVRTGGYVFSSIRDSKSVDDDQHALAEGYGTAYSSLQLSTSTDSDPSPPCTPLNFSIVARPPMASAHARYVAVYFHWTSLPKSEECGVASRFTVRVTPQKNVRPDEAVASTDDDGRLSLIVQLPIEKTCRFEPCRVAKLEPNTTYVAQLQSVGQSGRQSAWSTLTFTTPDLSRRGDAIEVEAEGDFRPDATHAVEAAFSRVPCVPKQLETAMVSATSAQLTWLVPIRSSTCGAASTYTVEYARYDDDELIPNSHDTNMLAKKKSVTILRNAQWFFLNFGQNRSHEHRAPVGTADYTVSYVLDNLHADSNYVARIESYNAQGKSPHYSPVVYFSTLRVDAPPEAGEIVSQTRQRRRHPSSRTTTTHATTAKSTTHGHHHHTSASTTRHPPPHTRPHRTDDDDDYEDGDDDDNNDDDNSSDEHPARTGIIVAGVGMGIGLLVCFVVVARRGVRYMRKRGAAQLP